MGGNPYWYFAEFRDDVATSLALLRKREFEARRYEPAMAVFPRDGEMELKFPIDPDAPTPGARHANPEEALAASGADGTRSILDIARVSLEPVAPPNPADPIATMGFGGGRQFRTSYPLEPLVLEEIFGTDKPTRGTIDAALFGRDRPEAADVLWDVPRGTAIHIVAYTDGEPTEVFFLGYSFD